MHIQKGVDLGIQVQFFIIKFLLPLETVNFVIKCTKYANLSRRTENHFLKVIDKKVKCL